MDSRQVFPTVSPMLLQHTLRGLCSNSRWIYAVFWRILPRNYPPPQWNTEGGIMDRSKATSAIVWEDGFCKFMQCNNTKRFSPFLHVQQRPGNDDNINTMSPELFFKMSHEVYNYGEGLMGKVAVDNSHKWVYRQPLEYETSFLSLDPHPRTWEAQFKSGIQTIAVVAVQEGVLQLGSTRKITEDLSFILYMQRTFSFSNATPTGSQWTPPGAEHARSMANGQLNASCSINPFLSPRLGPGPWRATHNVAGMKRPSEIESPIGSKLKPEYSYLGIDPNASNRPECPSSPKALNTWQLHPTLLPSMSSLQALLSKLPSVTIPNNNHGRFEVAAGGSFASTWSLQGRRDGMHEGESSDEDQTRNFDSSVAIETQRRQNSTFLDPFDNFGVQEALESGDSRYSSFLNEICS